MDQQAGRYRKGKGRLADAGARDAGASEILTWLSNVWREGNDGSGESLAGRSRPLGPGLGVPGFEMEGESEVGLSLDGDIE